jgi:hypothetical protein
MLTGKSPVDIPRRDALFDEYLHKIPGNIANLITSGATIKHATNQVHFMLELA